MRLILFLAPLLVLVLASPVRAEVTTEDITRTIDAASLRHPYLYFTEAEKPALLARIQGTPETAHLYRRFTAEANRLLHTPVEVQAPPQEPHPGFTNSDPTLGYLRRNMHAAHLLAFVYQMTGDERYARKAFEFADAVCDLPTWVDRRHQFPIIYSRVWPWGVRDDQAAFGFDIESADTARMLAAVYDWLYPALSKRERDRIRGALLEKAITRVRGNAEYHWWAESYRCNWSPICWAGLGTASLALMTEDPNLRDLVAESHNRVILALNEIGEDGGWQEGCGYYRKGIHGMNFFADPLKRLSGGKFNLYAHPKIAANPISFLLANTVTPKRLLVTADSGANRAGTSHIWNKLAEETRSPETAWFRNFMFGDASDIFDLIWPRASVKPALPVWTSRHFRTIDWAVMRSSFTDPEKPVLLAKAGMHDDPHHGHLDCGHFVIYWKNREYIRDIGSPEYDELFFDEARWTYPQAAGIGHNIILVNGEGQIPGKHKDEPWQEGVGGKILEFRAGNSRDYALVDASNAYPKRELRSWRRHLALEKPEITVVLDEVESARGAEIEARFHSECPVRLREEYALLGDDKGLMALIPLAETAFRFRSGRHADLPVMEDARFEWIPYFGTVLSARDEKTALATIILPVKDENEAKAVTASAKLKRDGDETMTVRFARGGREYTFRFERGAEGLALEK